ncbi:hypothetical protein CAPTEDRAFT_218647 [Capitella teleta]|uniref:G-protein coupled receptors family 1 profile domain-containing protein n=1 Tax=Capitella teleta TaxID=283909 RepID=R7UNY7_CAPTE|nr:hypothetical protein CAPTEDRAFT_218647 [Capitella teleta]|eukprot:ELU05076.1 hypothetical protein CAPTEDRAFT_218647 [Capitella teleta]
MNETSNNSIEWEPSLCVSLLLYIPPVLLVIGITGHLLTLAVVLTKQYRNTSASIVLGSLAVADSAQLATSLLTMGIAETRGLDITEYNAVTCKLSSYMTSVFMHLPPSLIVTMTIERFISVFLPFQAKTLCSKYRMTLAVMVVATTIAALNSVFLFIVTKQGSGSCGIYETYEYEFFRFWPWVDFVIASLYPSIIIVIGNILIIHKLFTSRSAVAGRKVMKSQKSMTMTLILISASFALLTWPSCLVYITKHSEFYPGGETGPDLLYTVTILMFYANSSVNFFLYCLSGCKFRGALRGLFTCSFSRKKRVVNRRGIYAIT